MDSWLDGIPIQLPGLILNILEVPPSRLVVIDVDGTPGHFVFQTRRALLLLRMELQKVLRWRVVERVSFIRGLGRFIKSLHEHVYGGADVGHLLLDPPCVHVGQVSAASEGLLYIGNRPVLVVYLPEGFNGIPGALPLADSYDLTELEVGEPGLSGVIHYCAEFELIELIPA